MLQINGLTEGLELFKTLGSEVRLRIVQLLSEQGTLSLTEIASSLGLTSGAVTPHIRRLEESGIITISQEHTGRGLKKNCSLEVDEILLNVYPTMEALNTRIYETDVPIGQYSDFGVHAGCGLAGDSALIGVEDDPRSFAWPERLKAGMLWFHDGFIEYRIPNLLPEGTRIMQLTLSFEISSADQGLPEDSLSDIAFSLNGESLGNWLTIRQADQSRGIYTPHWWPTHVRGHGYLHMIVINSGGVFLDGVKVRETGPDWRFLDSFGEMKLRFSCHPENGHEGGLALYGSNFGNYKQNIHVRVHYEPEDTDNG